MTEDNRVAIASGLLVGSVCLVLGVLAGFALDSETPPETITVTETQVEQVTPPVCVRTVEAAEALTEKAADAVALAGMVARSAARGDLSGADADIGELVGITQRVSELDERFASLALACERA